MPATRVRLIAPSGYPRDRAAIARGVARLREADGALDGLDVLDRVEQRYAGSDAERAADINALATLDALPDIALALRGGYGATRLLQHLQYDALRERLAGTNTVLVGHSDFTAIQLALHAKCGLVTFGGPMFDPDFDAETLSELTLPHFWRTVRAAQGRAEWNSSGEHALDIEGPLWGGNLAMLCSLLGTPYFPRIDDGILFVEDVGEPPFRIERLLYQLHLSGVLGRQRALILGDFTDCRSGVNDNGYGLAAAFAQIRGVVDIPVLDGLPFGHVPDKFTLPFGVPARLRAEGSGVRLDFSGYPHLA
ncbi:muramoyltetrapeptide carboxypeptidase [Rhodanobacter sp. DHG33]|uniref:muramoyltetrapeptide carboxypeptidase n=1 Tax=Rhodanobacter sp. DHG33 TaxID=2775921 RepID=UPI00177EBB31|nr:muramoyltetrapeptide carboxypeptidase [Rhodanobacter sp. DHG33]MBD8899300.1 muramoyltetrapeptide carboxypeptidase [Rhodanobacter sp. DHG33]